MGQSQKQPVTSCPSAPNTSFFSHGGPRRTGAVRAQNFNGKYKLLLTKYAFWKMGWNTNFSASHIDKQEKKTWFSIFQPFKIYTCQRISYIIITSNTTLDEMSWITETFSPIIVQLYFIYLIYWLPILSQDNWVAFHNVLLEYLYQKHFYPIHPHNGKLTNSYTILCRCCCEAADINKA